MMPAPWGNSTDEEASTATTSKAGTRQTSGDLSVVPDRPAVAERITVALVPKAGQDLRSLQERTHLSKTDIANRAIMLYEFIEAQLSAGKDLLIRDADTGETQLVVLV
jgi:hypothetical protein